MDDLADLVLSYFENNVLSYSDIEFRLNRDHFYLKPNSLDLLKKVATFLISMVKNGYLKHIKLDDSSTSGNSCYYLSKASYFERFNIKDNILDKKYASYLRNIKRDYRFINYCID